MLLCWLSPKGYLEEVCSACSHSLPMPGGYLPDVSVRVVIILTKDTEIIISDIGPRILSQYDFIENMTSGTDSLRGAMTDATCVLSSNSLAMRFMIASVRSIFVWLVCHSGGHVLWPE